LLHGRYLNSDGVIIKAQSVTLEETRIDYITSVNKVVHQLVLRTICVVVVVKPKYSIANTQHLTTPTKLVTPT
jgi:hypothetical protein